MSDSRSAQPSMEPAPGAGDAPQETRRELAGRHLQFGWTSLAVWLTLGIVLEGLHGFKADWYLRADREMTRLMLTLAHAHGTLLAFLNVLLSLCLYTFEHFPVRPLASRCIWVGSLLTPLGFLAGGLWRTARDTGDPSLGVLLVIPGAFLLAAGVLAIAASVSRATK